jgi:hypothetical protein
VHHSTLVLPGDIVDRAATDPRLGPYLSPSRVLELFFPRGIRRSKHRAEIKLFAEYLWLRAGCCHREICFHPSQIYHIGNVDYRTGEKLLSETIQETGWFRLLGKSGRRTIVESTPEIWQPEIGGPNQRRLFDAPQDIPPEALGGDPRLVVPYLLPLNVWEDESIDAAHKLVFWFVLLESGLRCREFCVNIKTTAGELARATKRIRESIRRLAQNYWQIAEHGNGAFRLKLSDLVYLPNQADELRLLVKTGATGARRDRRTGATGARRDRRTGATGARRDRLYRY